jgi:hypothetical protein
MNFVEISKELHPYLGKPELGTRIYKMEGSQEEAGRWFDVVTAAVGPTISLGAVHMFCPVSRSALHERLDRGKLTVFEFNVVERRANFLSTVTNKVIRKEPYAYVPVSECRSWRLDIEARAKAKGMSDEDIAAANLSQFDKLVRSEQDEDDQVTKTLPAKLEIPLSQYDLQIIEQAAGVLKYDSPGKLIADLLKPVIDGGFSGLSCTKAGIWLMRQMEKHNVGKVPMPKFIENLRNLKS